MADEAAEWPRRLVQVTAPSSQSACAVRYGTLRYTGEVEGTKGTWLGVEWDQPGQGKHDGEYKGRRYFNVSQPGCQCGSFIRPPVQNASPSEIVIGQSSFLDALRYRYIGDDGETACSAGKKSDRDPTSYSRRNLAEIEIETPNMAKVRHRVAQLNRLKVVALTGPSEHHSAGESAGDKSTLLRIRSELLTDIQALVGQAGRDGEEDHAVAQLIHATIPNVQYLDLSRSLLSSMRQIATIVQQLDSLKTLHIHHNRLHDLSSQSMAAGAAAPRSDKHEERYTTILTQSKGLANITEIGLVGNKLSWSDFLGVAPYLPRLETLLLAQNGIRRLAATEDDKALASVQAQPVRAALLRDLNLEANELDCWQDICSALSALPQLKRLHLSNNRLTKIEGAPKDGGTEHLFPLDHLSLSGNPLFDLSWGVVTVADDQAASLRPFPNAILERKMEAIWASLYNMDASVAAPGLRSLSAMLTTGDEDISDTNAPFSPAELVSYTQSVETQCAQWRFNVIARLPALAQLNGTEVTAAQRKDAELWWLGQMDQRLSRAATAAQHAEIIQKEPAWARLGQRYEHFAGGQAPDENASRLRASGTIQSKLLALTLRLSPTPPPPSGAIVQMDGIDSVKTVSNFKVLPNLTLKSLRAKISRTLVLAKGQEVQHYAVLKSQSRQADDPQASDATGSQHHADQFVSFELDDELRELGQSGLQHGDELWVVVAQ
ncbi:unnamed protein product [Parajaminaea phylloscopi]